MGAAPRLRVLKTPKPPTPDAAPGVEPRLVSINDAAAMLGVGRDTIYKLLKSGKLRSLKFGSRHVVVVASIDALLAAMLGEE